MSSQNSGGRLHISLKSKKYKSVQSNAKCVPAPRGTNTSFSASERRRVEEQESEGEWISSEMEQEQEEGQNQKVDGTADRYDFDDPFLDTSDLSSDDDDDDDDDDKTGAPPDLGMDLGLKLAHLHREYSHQREQEFEKQRKTDRQFWIHIHRLFKAYIPKSHK